MIVKKMECHFFKKIFFKFVESVLIIKILYSWDFLKVNGKLIKKTTTFYILDVKKVNVCSFFVV